MKIEGETGAAESVKKATPTRAMLSRRLAKSVTGAGTLGRPRGAGNRGRVHDDLDLVTFFRFQSLSKANGLQALIVEPEVFRQILANHVAARFGKLAVLVGVSRGSARDGNHGHSKPIVLEKLPHLVQLFLMFQLGRVGFVENLSPIENKGLGRWPHRQSRDFVVFQVGGILIAALLKESAQEKVVFQRLHVFAETCGAGRDFLISLLVVDQSADGSFTLIHFSADVFKIAASLGNVLDGGLA